MHFNYPEIKSEPALGTRQNWTFCHQMPRHVVHTAAKKVISRHWKNENVFKMSKDEKCTCKACKIFFSSLSNMQICVVFVAVVVVIAWAPYFSATQRTHCFCIPNMETTLPCGRAISVRQLPFAILSDNVFWNRCIYTHFFRNMVRAWAQGKRRMRNQNTKTTVPLDVAPERRTERCSPRFRPGGRFCELRFRYQSSPTGIEGEISRPLDHMWQIPFIHSTRFIVSTNFYIYRTVF